jgi:hypothetical protein
MNRLALAASLFITPLAAMGAIKSEEIPELRPPREELPAPVVVVRDQRVWVFAGAGAVLILVALCWPRAKPVPPPPDPFAIAKRELGALRANPTRATTVEVSAIVRRYAVAAFELPGQELTSEEVITGLGLCQLCPSEMANAAWQFLSDCDVAKFAPGVPPAEMSGLLGRAEKLLADMEAARKDSVLEP